MARKGRETINLCRGACGKTQIFVEISRVRQRDGFLCVRKVCRECGWKRTTHIPYRQPLRLIEKPNCEDCVTALRDHRK